MSTSPMKIGTLGTGRMAATLGKLWAMKGHQVFFGSRESAKARALAESIGANCSGGSQSEAVTFGDAIVLAVPWTAAEETLKDLGPFDGRILIDITNPVKPTDGGLQLAVGHTTSIAEQIAGWAPGAKVVKAFNSIYFEVLEKPRFGPENASSFSAGMTTKPKQLLLS